MELPWMYLKDVVLGGVLIWVAWIYRNHAKATKTQLETLQRNQDALLSQAKTLKTYIDTNLQLLDGMKSEALLKDVQSAKEAFKITADAKAEEIEQRLTRERDEALTGKKTVEEQARRLAATTKDMISQVVQTSIALGHAVYCLPEWQRTGFLGLIGSGVAKVLANHYGTPKRGMVHLPLIGLTTNSLSPS
jgi:hypothetical protein